jgi:hypothetical protein
MSSESMQLQLIIKFAETYVDDNFKRGLIAGQMYSKTCVQGHKICNIPDMGFTWLQATQDKGFNTV